MSNPHVSMPIPGEGGYCFMIQIALCDDNTLHLKYAASLIERAYPPAKVEINAFSGGPALLKSLRLGDYVPDVAVLDIRMEEGDGISLAGELNRLAPACRVIFLTAYSEYAPEVYTTRHVWFIPKERAEDFLIPAIERALATAAPQGQTEHFTLRSQGKTVLVPLQNLLYIDRVGRKTRLVCLTEEHLVNQSPAELIPSTAAPWMIRCHQGYWVNGMHVRSIDHNEFVLDNQQRIPISRTFRDAARARFFDLNRI